ncbi:S-adenosyl-L-methionine-dependent methyltransferase [Suillus subalutaceus]|uniref:S-adenosyl-L-methionine-dependent methyltransferase n=1 Tax=Suillus subalutaceus TaxID=48586 RepID=UPI001B8871E3|nr:S-adenosyl-L-methionine-dependent methyltransferase [Suillus subalutaceus]KAG1859569.1 S-adenosyl-L-methionine-dependent methyltransferase [Suillus subalutaceus]
MSAFSSYYKAQHIIPEEEWDQFMETLRRPLPTTFRIAGSREIAHALNDAIKKTYVPLLSDVVFEGDVIPPPSRIPWYPEDLAWQFNVSKKVLRKQQAFKKFHSFLVHETEVGNISRQEAVSMLPPLFLDVQPHHKVVDMCAAPGSKTAQLLEALHAQDTATATSIPPGLLIANDSDSKRAHLLIHQSARLPSPAFMVTNLDASIFPVLRLPVTTADPRRGSKKSPNQLLFDRILCDVPCSGDGTLRKNIGIWKRWQPMDGNGLHSLQTRILQRAMRMLEPDGRIVYSTCSLNPVENEAVIAAALNSNPDFQLIDVSAQLPELVRRPGISSWAPTVNRTINTTFKTWDAYNETLTEEQRADSKMSETHWPPINAESLQLHHCMRIYPHLQDTGGFFVAVLERKPRQSNASVAVKLKIVVPEAKKVKLDLGGLPEPQQSASFPPTPMSEDDDSRPLVLDTVEADAQAASDTKKTTFKGKPKLSDPSFKEMPYTFLEPNDPTLISCIDQLNLTATFPSSNILVRNPAGDAVRSFYLTNDLVKAVVLNNDYTRMRLMTSGTKVITKQEAGRGLEAQFRVLGEGLPVVLPYIDPSVILDAEFVTLKTLLITYYPLCYIIFGPNKSPGSHIVRFPAGCPHDLLVPLWKSNVSVTLMIDKKAKSALSLRLFGEDITTAARDGGKKTPQTSQLPQNTGDVVPDEGADNEDEDAILEDEGDNEAE